MLYYLLHALDLCSELVHLMCACAVAEWISHCRLDLGLDARSAGEYSELVPMLYTALQSGLVITD